MRVLGRLLAPGLPWTVIVATTQPELLAQLSRVVVLVEGKLVAEGTLEQVQAVPALRALLGTAPADGPAPAAS